MYVGTGRSRSETEDEVCEFSPVLRAAWKLVDDVVRETCVRALDAMGLEGGRAQQNHERAARSGQYARTRQESALTPPWQSEGFPPQGERPRHGFRGHNEAASRILAKRIGSIQLSLGIRKCPSTDR